VDSPFDCPALRIQQPGKLMPDRASYEIFDDQRRLVAIAAETEAHTRMRVLSKSMPDARVLAITTTGNEPVLTLIKHARERVTELQDPLGEPAGWIQAMQTNRYYTLIDGQGQPVGKVVGDLPLKIFSVTGGADREFARIRKTWAGVKEMLTAADDYHVEFTAPVSPPARTLTVVMAIVLDLTLYEPV
jgi:Scramblase